LSKVVTKTSGKRKKSVAYWHRSRLKRTPAKRERNPINSDLVNEREAPYHQKPPGSKKNTRGSKLQGGNLTGKLDFPCGMENQGGEKKEGSTLKSNWNNEAARCQLRPHEERARGGVWVAAENEKEAHGWVADLL